MKKLVLGAVLALAITSVAMADDQATPAAATADQNTQVAPANPNAATATTDTTDTDANKAAADAGNKAQAATTGDANVAPTAAK